MGGAGEREGTMGRAGERELWEGQESYGRGGWDNATDTVNVYT